MEMSTKQLDVQSSDTGAEAGGALRAVRRDGPEGEDPTGRTIWHSARREASGGFQRRTCKERLSNPGEVGVSKSLSPPLTQHTHTPVRTHVAVLLPFCGTGRLLCNDFSRISTCTALRALGAEPEQCLCPSRRQDVSAPSCPMEPAFVEGELCLLTEAAHVGRGWSR